MAQNNNSPKIYRPWGYYQDIFSCASYKIKLITVKPREALSLQFHQHRSENWHIEQGSARARKGGKEQTLKPGDWFFIPAGEIHRIENIGKIDLVFTEVQAGRLLDEEDIIRIEDKYNRVLNESLIHINSFKKAQISL